MKTSTRKLLCIAGINVLLMFYSINAYAQMCSVNAGVDKTICVTQALILSGSVGSSQSSTASYLWTKLAGPAATIASPTSLTSNVTGITPGNYVFQLSNKCIDGLYAKDIISITVLPEPPTPLAGRDTTFCTNTAVHLSANAVAFPCIGTWTVSPAGGSFFPDEHAANAVYTGPTRAGIRKFTWTISNGACQKSDVVQVGFIEAIRPVSAGPDTMLSCKGKCVVLSASYPGYLPQHGLWSTISGPNIPSFSNPADYNPKVCNLVPGIYRFRWKVSGPCLNDSDDVVINVIDINIPPASLGDQVYTNFCEVPAVNSEVLTGAALSPGDTVTWTQTGGGSVATFIPDNHHATVTVGSLTGPFPYKFTYTHSSASGCTMVTTHTVYRSQLITGLTDPPDQVLPCDVTATTFNISYNRLSTISNSVTRRAVFVSGPMDSGRVIFLNTTFNSLTRTDTWSVDGLTLAGTYTYRIEYSNACGTSYQEISITVSRTPGTVNAGSDIVLPCHDLEITPIGSANAPGIYSWSQVSGPNAATITNANLLSPGLNGMIQGIYTIRLTNWGGNACPLRTDDMNVIVTQLPPLAAVVAHDTAACAGNFQLSGNEPMATETGTWTVDPPAGISFSPDEHAYNAFVSGLQPNSGYTFTWTVSNACGTLSAAQNITTGLFVSPPVPDAGADFCAVAGTSTLNLSGNNPADASVLWTALTPGSTVSSPNQQTTQAGFTNGSGVYLFEYALGSTGCGIFRDTVQVTIKTNVQVNAGSDMSFCARDFPYSLTMDGSISSRLTNFPAIWSQLAGPSPAVIVDIHDPHTTIQNLQPGFYQFEYKVIPSNDCDYIADTISIQISSEPSDAIAGPDQSICNATIRTLVYLSANTPASGIGHWQILSSPPGSPSPVFSDESSPFSTITNLTQGTYHLRWIITNGNACAAKTDDMDINISVTAYAGTSISSCSASTILLSGNPNTNGTWTRVSGPIGTSIIANSGNTAIVSGLITMASPTIYTFRYSLPGVGACNASYDDVTFNNYALPSTANAGGDRLVCFNETTVTLSGNIPAAGRASWIWQSGPNNPIAGSANNSSADTILNNLVQGIYVFQYRVSTNAVCPASTDNIQIIKQAKANAQADLRLCNVNNVYLNASPAMMGQGTWSYQSGPLAPGAVIFSDSHNPASNVTGLVPGVYIFRWSIDSIGTCARNFDDIQVTIDPAVPQANAGNNRQFCQGSVVPFNLGTGAVAGIIYTWTPVAMLSNPNMAQPVFQGVNNPGNYVYTVRAAIGSCESFASININVKPTPFANIEIIDSSCMAVFKASDPGNGVINPVYNWNFGPGVNPTTATGAGPHNVEFNNSGPRTITLQIVSADACNNSSSIVFMPYCLLPVTLVSFDATWKMNYAALHWKVENALNLDHFGLERSYDGRIFNYLNNISYLDNTSNYQYNDNTADANANTQVFYRLRMVDHDNRFSYSMIKKIKFKSTDMDISVWPNPFKDKISISYNATHFSANASLKIYSATGALIVNQLATFNQGNNVLEMDKLGNLPTGLYTLQIIAEGKILFTHKIIKYTL